MSKNRDIADILDKSFSLNAALDLSNTVVYDVATYTSSNTNAQTLESFPTTSYRTAIYFISMAASGDYQSSTIKLVHDGTTSYISESAVVVTDGDLATFSTDINSGNVRLLVTPANASTTFKISKILFKI